MPPFWDQTCVIPKLQATNFMIGSSVEPLFMTSQRKWYPRALVYTTPVWSKYCLVAMWKFVQPITTLEMIGGCFIQFSNDWLHSVSLTLVAVTQGCKNFLIYQFFWSDVWKISNRHGDISKSHFWSEIHLHWLAPKLYLHSQILHIKHSVI